MNLILNLVLIVCFWLPICFCTCIVSNFFVTLVAFLIGRWCINLVNKYILFHSHRGKKISHNLDNWYLGHFWWYGDMIITCINRVGSHTTCKVGENSDNKVTYNTTFFASHFFFQKRETFQYLGKNQILFGFYYLKIKY